MNPDAIPPVVPRDGPTREAARAACPNCGTALDLYQPDHDLPERLFGTCDDCKSWFLVVEDAGVSLLQPSKTTGTGAV